mmetsp:Transcript_9938/g.12520  ORF Transcript_9938/g.12520 Transcript_9938/m.12520 type:complete len:176 (-) Transcript_9938:118-645(-)
MSDESLQNWVPSQSPETWIVINTVCFIYSLLLSFYIVQALGDLGERPSAQASYIIWNFGTTLVWCFEAGIESWWNYRMIVVQRQNDSQKISWWRAATSSGNIANLIELLVAVYFSIGSAVLLWKWAITGENLNERLLDVVTNLVFYFYAMVRDFVRLHSILRDDRLKNEMYTQIE